VDLRDPAGDQLLADRRCVHLGEKVLDRVVRCGRDLLENRVGIVVSSLDALEVQHREAAESGELAGEPGIDDRVHRGGDDRNREREPGQRTGQVDVGRFDRLRAGCE
jgi:hypothetical protein